MIDRIIKRHFLTQPMEIAGGDHIFVGDPAYDEKFAVGSLKPGRWFFWADVSNRFARPIQIGAICVPSTDKDFSVRDVGGIGVDSASCCISKRQKIDDYDRGVLSAIAMYPPRFGTYRDMVVSLSGWGDGFYNVEAYEDCDFVVGVRVVFIGVDEVLDEAD